MDFNGIIGQGKVIGSLKRALAENRVGHAYIFSGPDGIGKKTIARIFAGLLLCEDPKDGASCGSCIPCRMYENGSNPDYHAVACDEASIGVDLIRQMQSDVAIKPMYSKRKVYIIEDASKMTEQAQNCLLKTFEEPPPYVVIILLSNNYDALLETIRSRAQRINFSKYTYEQVYQAVMQKYAGVAKQVELAVSYADGNIGIALELAGSGELSILRDKTLELVTCAARGETDKILEFETFLDDNKESIGLILDILLLYYRDLLVMSETGNENILINSDKKDMILKNVRMYSNRRILSSIAAVEEIRRAVKQNANYQLSMDKLLIKIREDTGW
jgi:DNA polymerase-3 subunit delta'